MTAPAARDSIKAAGRAARGGLFRQLIAVSVCSSREEHGTQPPFGTGEPVVESSGADKRGILMRRTKNGACALSLQIVTGVSLLVTSGGLFAVGCGGASPRRTYTAIGVEMAIVDEKLKNRDTIDGSESLGRLYYAGPAAVPELAGALGSPERLHRQIAGEALRSMTRYWKWPEAYAFVVKRIKRSPASEEAAELLYAAAHEGIRDYPVILPYVAAHLHDTNRARTLAINSPDNTVEMRVCDYSAYIIQLIAGVDFGVGEHRRSDEAVAKARAWVKRNSAATERGR